MTRFFIENKGEWDFPNRKWAVDPYWLIHDGVAGVGPTRIDDPYIGEVLDSMVGAIKGTEAECDVWVDETEKRDATIASQAAHIERLHEALKTVTVNLMACHSLLGSGGKRAAGSDKMFEIMMSDYAKAIEVGRSTAWPASRRPTDQGVD